VSTIVELSSLQSQVLESAEKANVKITSTERLKSQFFEG